MTRRPALSLCVLLLVSMLASGMHCSRKLSPQHAEKIGFDYSQLDTQGLRYGETAVDYEFCIPADESAWMEIAQIAPHAQRMKKSKGRVGCRDTAWLIIVNTHHPKWKKQLYAIAALPYVDRIAEVFWE